jgi:hypothetical protein
MKRFFVVAAIVALVSVPGTASAQESPGGCQAFGQAVANEAQTFGGLGGIVSQEAPVNEDVAFFHELLCG